MLDAILGLALLAGGPGGLDPSTLIGELGSPRYLQRESAEAALIGLGRGALPSLRAALDSRDPEVRLRARSILTRIEGTLLVEPTPILFDFDRVPLIEAIRTIDRRTGLTLRLLPENDPAWASTRLTLRAVEPMPFWKGVDALCEAGGLHYVFGAQQATGRRDGAFPLYPGQGPPPEPVWDSGPFRTHLASVHYQSEIQLSRARISPTSRGDRPPADDGANAPSAATRQFYLQCQTAAEPRLSITQNGAPRISEAVDELGKSLLIASTPATLQRTSGYFGMNPSSLVRFRVDLAYPESTSRRIKRIRGTVPVIVATRKDDPLKIPLEAATGKSFRGADVDLTVREIRAARDGQPPAIELTLRPLGGPANPAADDVDPMAARLESPQEQLEVLDAGGQPIAWFPSSSFFNGEESRLTLSLLSQGPIPPRPSTIAYHAMARLATEVPFEFRDVPIP